MSGIHEAVLQRIQTVLQAALIDDVPLDDPARASIVQLGPLQGDPDPDEACIYATVHENDPDNLDESEEWHDEVDEIECGGAMTWSRKFVVKIRALLEGRSETLTEAREIASTLAERAEVALLKELFVGITSGNEYVSRGPMASEMTIATRQGGGPPDAYDFHIKIRFDVLTTRTGVYA